MGMDLGNYDAEFEANDGYVSDSELVSHVRDALRFATQGDQERYNQLIDVMSHTERMDLDQQALLVTSLRALSVVVLDIDDVHHRALLSSIFGMNIWIYAADVMDAVRELIVSLAGSNARLVDDCLDMLISNLRPPLPFVSALDHPRGFVRKEQVFNVIHSALKDIVELVPLAPLKLLPIIVRYMPRTNDKQPVLTVYLENILKLESASIGELVGSTMIMAVVDKMIDLDLEIEWDDILQEDSNKGIFDMEIEDVEEIDYGDIHELSKGRLSRKSLSTNAVANKLDSMLVITCEHLKFCAKNGRLFKVFETLLQSFQLTILNAYKSKFVQFLIFYACSLDPENCGVKFATLLTDIFLGKANPPLTRMSAVAYLSSYMSRGRFISSSLVVNTLKRLVDWSVEYCKTTKGQKTKIPVAHRVYYSACQAIMYILCFRMRSIMESPQLKTQLTNMPLEFILSHSLKPLEVCLPPIVEEFVHQAKAANLFVVRDTCAFIDLLESDLSKAYGGMERLDMFFPFDPCLLKGADSYIRPSFMFWSMVKTTYDDDEVDDIIEDLTVEEERGSLREDAMTEYITDHDFDVDEFEFSLNKMSITPKEPTPFKFPDGLVNPIRMPAQIRPSTSPDW